MCQRAAVIRQWVSFVTMTTMVQATVLVGSSHDPLALAVAISDLVCELVYDLVSVRDVDLVLDIVADPDSDRLWVRVIDGDRDSDRDADGDTRALRDRDTVRDAVGSLKYVADLDRNGVRVTVGDGAGE